MIITKKALPRRTFLRGMGATLALPLLDAMIPSMTALAATAAAPARLRRLGFVYMPMGCDITRWTPPGADRSTSCRRSSARWPRSRSTSRRSRIWSCKNAYPGTHATSNCRVPERRPRETDGEHRLLSRHDGRSDRGQANRPGDATAVARTVDGSALGRRPVRQRLCLRLSEQSVLVVADDAAAGRGSSADRVREAVRRRRHHRGPPGRARRSARACSIR